jgi:hypothetical protein
MRTRTLVTTASVLALAIAAPAFARPQTTNAPPILTIKVTLTDNSITVKPNSAARGTNTIFILTNRGTKTRTWLLGDAGRGVGKKIGFASVLAPNQQKTVVMFLDYRGLLPYSSSPSPGATKNVLKGSFRIR